MAKGRGGGGGPRRPPDPRLELQHEPPKTSGATWEVTVTAIASQGNNVLAARPVQFFQSVTPAGHACLTDANGRVSYAFTGLSLDNDQQVTVEAQLVSTPFRARLIIPAPKKKEAEKQIPAKLLVKPARVGNRITLMICVTDISGKNVPKFKITIVDSNFSNPQTFETDEDGELLHPIDLNFGEEREISIYAAGYGKGIHRTFYGRK